jgi:hypothetical protein
MRIAGEEDALERGALRVMVRPKVGGAYLVTAALGFRDASMPSGVFGCPNAEEICVIAGGYGYIARVSAPEQVTMLSMKPLVSVNEADGEGLLLFVGFHSVLGWGVEGLAWETGRLSWEGLRVTRIEASVLRGFGSADGRASRRRVPRVTLTVVR